MAVSLTTAGMNSNTYIRANLDLSFNTTPGAKVNSFSMNFILRGPPTSGTLYPLLTPATGDYGVFLNTNGELVIKFTDGSQVNTDPVCSPSRILNVEHSISMKFVYETTTARNIVVEYFGATVYSYRGGYAVQPSYRNIGTVFGSTQITAPIELREFSFSGTLACGWLAQANQELLINNLITTTGDGVRAADTATTWVSDYGYSGFLEIVNIGGIPSMAWWRTYSPTQFSGGYSLLMGTNINQRLILPPADAPTVTIPGAEGYSRPYGVSFKWWNMFGDGMAAGDKIGILTDSSRNNGFFINSDCTIGVYMGGVEVVRSTLQFLGTSGSNAGRDVHYTTIVVDQDTKTVSFSSLFQIDYGGGRSFQQTVNIPAQFDKLNFPSTCLFDTICSQVGNSRSYNIKFASLSYYGFKLESMTFAPYQILSVDAVLSNRDVNGITCSLSDRVVRAVGYDSLGFSPWVYEGMEVQVSVKSKRPTSVSIPYLLDSPVVLDGTFFADLFIDHTNGDIFVAYEVFVDHPSFTWDSNNTTLTISDSNLILNETVLVRAAFNNYESFVYAKLSVSCLPFRAFSDTGFDVGFGSTANTPAGIIRRKAFSQEGFDSASYEMIVDVPVSTGSGIKRWNGSAWVDVPLYRWNGTSWVTATVKRWNGSAWV